METHTMTKLKPNWEISGIEYPDYSFMLLIEEN